MSVVSFSDYIPSPRFDNVPWTQVLIEEGVSDDGPWNLIDTIALNPLDVNPSSPQARSFTTDNATLIEGWYRVSFKDAQSNILLTDPVYNAPYSEQDYRPTISQVARKNTQRTRDQYGNLQGTFTPGTVPTDTQVAAIISDVTPEIADVIGDEIPAELVDDAANVVALRAAMQVELDFYSDQVNTGRSIYPQLRDQFNDALQRLQAAVLAAEAGDGTVQPTGPSLAPQYSFPDPGLGFRTRW